jgi:hypothetical protein
VWSVIPGIRTDMERRAGFDRRSPDPVFLYKGTERRTTPDRRRSAVSLPAELASGWLIFESPDERRRLSPIPPHWDVLSETDLSRLLSAATPAVRIRVV